MSAGRGAALVVLLCAPAAVGEEPPKIHWQFGPLKVAAGPGADLTVPRGAIWAGKAEARRFLEFTGNPVRGDEVGVAGSPELDWFAVFSWRDYARLGFDARRPDPERIARAVAIGGASANRARARMGREALEVVEWKRAPEFDERTGRLEFELKSEESGGRGVENRFVYFLGKRGVLEVEVVREAGGRAEGVESVMAGLAWRPGEAYNPPFDWTGVWVLGVAAVGAATIGFRLWRQRGQ